MNDKTKQITRVAILLLWTLLTASLATGLEITKLFSQETESFSNPGD